MIEKSPQCLSTWTAATYKLWKPWNTTQGIRMCSCSYALLKSLLGESWCLGIWATLVPSIGFPKTFLFSMVPVPDTFMPYHKVRATIPAPAQSFIEMSGLTLCFRLILKSWISWVQPSEFIYFLIFHKRSILCNHTEVNKADLLRTCNGSSVSTAWDS